MGYSPWGRKELDSTEVTAGMQRPHFVGRPDPHLTRKETKFTCERQPSPYSYECGVFANRSLKRQLGAAGGPVVGAPRFHGRGRKFDLLIGELESHTSWGMGKIDVRIKKYPEHLLEGLMLKLQYSGRLMRRAISLEKTLMLGKTEGRRQKGMTEGEMVGWHPRLNGHEFQPPLGDGEGPGSLACCSPWGCRVRHN